VLRKEGEHPGSGPSWAHPLQAASTDPDPGAWAIHDRSRGHRWQRFGLPLRTDAQVVEASRFRMRNITPHLLDTALRSLIRSQQDPISRDLEAVHIRVVPGAL
jgi:hypothetical protein